MDLMYNM